MKDWQKGVPLEELRALAAPFKRHHKALVFGAFGLTKELDVATALDERRLIWTGPRSAPKGVAIARLLKRPSVRTDFAQRDVTLAGGSVLVEAIAADDADSAGRMLSALLARASGAPVWCEAFEEDGIVRSALYALGFSWQSTLIKAGSELKGLYAKGAPLVEPLPGEELATQTLLEPALLSAEETRSLLADIERFGETWAQHYSSYNKRRSWTAVSLRGYSDDPNFIPKPAEMSRAWKEEHPELLKAEARWTPAAAALPRLRQLAERIAPFTDRVRLMRLAGGGELTRHADITDREAGVQEGKLLRLHVPLRTDFGVRFHGWSARGQLRSQHFGAGSLFYLDQRKPHRVSNDSGVDRIHLVIDAWSTPELRARLAEAFRVHGF